MDHSNNIKVMLVDELFNEMDETRDHPEYHITVINVMPHSYFEDCRIKDSINIQAELIADYVEDWDRDRTLVVYDASDDSNTSDAAYRRLESMGFTDVRKLVGGIKQWVDQGYPTEGNCVADYFSKIS